MEKTAPKFSLKLLVFVLAGAVLLGVSGWIIYHFWSKRTQQFYTIGIFHDSTSQNLQDQEIITRIISKKVNEINNSGGVAGKEIRIKYLDDKGQRDTAVKLVQTTMHDSSLIAYLGCWSSTKARAVSKLVGEQNIPFIGGYGITSFALQYPNMFTYEIGIDQFAFSSYNLLKARGKRIAFIGNSDDYFTGVLYQKVLDLNKANPGFEIAVEKWFTGTGIIAEADLNELVKTIKSQADFIFISVNTPNTDAVLRKLWQNKIFLPTFCAFIDIPELDNTVPGFRQAELFDISVFGIPSALNMRTQVLKDQYKNEFQESVKLDFQLGLGALISDALGLIKINAETNLEEKNIRQRIVKGLNEFVNGDKIYRGWFTNWYFNEKRALISDAVLGWKPANYDAPILAPYQFLNTDSGIVKTEVLYTNIDLIKIHRVNDEQGSFNAAFYLEINSRGNINIKQIDFANVARNEINQEPLLDIKLLQADSVTGEKPLYSYLYKVSGKFYFVRNLKHYPFDKQQFTITLQTNSAFAPFLIQPPGADQRDTLFQSPGWSYVSNYVGYDQDVINTGSNFISQQKQIPFYKFNYSYVLRRTQADFFLKILTPLLAILIISYFSVFIPSKEFEALCGIQVTALLSAIALYFSTYKPEMQNATISDKIFIFTYIMITTLIGTSIFIYALHHKKMENSFYHRFLRVYQYYIFPVIVFCFTIIVRFSSF